LKDLKELRSLNISNTDIEDGLESILNYQLGHICCSSKEMLNGRVPKVSYIENKLKESSEDFESSLDGDEYTRKFNAQE